MLNLLGKFLTEIGFALLEYKGEGTYIPIVKLPAWFQRLWGGTDSTETALALSERSPFLENFLCEAETFWDTGGAGSCQSEIWIEKQPDGQEVPLQAKALRLGDKRVMVIFNPDTEFREHVKVLQAARNARLEHERLATEIQKKEILLHCIVHDLSQPLSVMHATMDCLRDEPISERSRHFLELGRVASEQQETMIRDILHAFSEDLRTSMDAGTEENASADLLECAIKTMNTLGPTFEVKGVRLEVSPSVDRSGSWLVRGESSRLQRIISNLLENALRYTPAKGRVTVAVEDEGIFLRACVDDDGPGLPKDVPPEQIFGLFTKGKQGGGKAGLGLYFCRITVERWGGKIGCLTLPEKGSRFWFRLPRAASEVVASVAEQTRKLQAITLPAKKLAARPLRILFADDQKDIRTLIAYQLNRIGHKVVIATNGKEALRRFRAGKFDAVLLDQEMPLMTGEEVALAIRKGESGKEKRVFLIASSGDVGADDRSRLKAAGFDAVLDKPFRMEDLDAILSLPVDKHIAPAAAASSAPSETIDFAALLNRVGGDDALLKRMIAIFLRDTPKRMTAIAKALSRNDVDAVASLAHALKGSVSIFAAEAPRLRAQGLQELSRAGDLTGARANFSALKEEIANLLENLKSCVHQSSAAGAWHRPARPGLPRKKQKRVR
jgi:signal transduction histidine kinase/CheY-like chemotaxis protein